MPTETSLHSPLTITIATAATQRKPWHRLSPCITEQLIHLSAHPYPQDKEKSHGTDRPIIWMDCLADYDDG